MPEQQTNSASTVELSQQASAVHAAPAGLDAGGMSTPSPCQRCQTVSAALDGIPVISPAALARSVNDWRGIGRAVVRDALAARRVELWSLTHWQPISPTGSTTIPGGWRTLAQRGHLLTGVGACQRAASNTRVATPGSVSTGHGRCVRKGADPKKTKCQKRCSCLRRPAASWLLSVSCVGWSGPLFGVFPAVRVLCCFSLVSFCGRRPKDRPFFAAGITFDVLGL